MLLSFGCQVTGVFYEVKVCEKPIVKLCVSNDDSHLFCISEDGLMIMFDVRAIAAPGVAGRDKDVIPWCHEVLITKVDLEDYRSRVQELERKVCTSNRHYRVSYVQRLQVTQELCPQCIA